MWSKILLFFSQDIPSNYIFLIFQYVSIFLRKNVFQKFKQFQHNFIKCSSVLDFNICVSFVFDRYERILLLVSKFKDKRINMVFYYFLCFISKMVLKNDRQLPIFRCWKIQWKYIRRKRIGNLKFSFYTRLRI